MKKKKTHSPFVIVFFQTWRQFSKNWGESAIRTTRLKRFRKKGQGLFLFLKIFAVWYLFMFTTSYLTSSTGANFNDMEERSLQFSTCFDFAGTDENCVPLPEEMLKDGEAAEQEGEMETEEGAPEVDLSENEDGKEADETDKDESLEDEGTDEELSENEDDKKSSGETDQNETGEVEPSENENSEAPEDKDNVSEEDLTGIGKEDAGENSTENIQDAESAELP